MASLPDCVTISETATGLRYYQVSHPLCHARIFEQGAQLVHFQAAGQPSMFWLSGAEAFQSGAAIRGGIPVCWPWFGPHPAGAGPAHGVARTLPWALDFAQQTPQGVRLGFRLYLTESPMAGLCAELVFNLGESLHVSLTSINQSSLTQQVSCALHSYFPVGDVRQAVLAGAEGRRYTDSLSSKQSVETNDQLVFDQEVDRIYYGSGPWAIHSPVLNLKIESQGSDSTVVWNPWVDKSTRLSHFKPDDYLRMVCVETGNCGQDSLSLEPGERHVTNVRYSYLPVENSR